MLLTMDTTLLQHQQESPTTPMAVLRTPCVKAAAAYTAPGGSGRCAYYRPRLSGAEDELTLLDNDLAGWTSPIATAIEPGSCSPEASSIARCRSYPCVTTAAERLNDDGSRATRLVPAAGGGSRLSRLLTFPSMLRLSSKRRHHASEINQHLLR
jgi:hypothetical protein